MCASTSRASRSRCGSGPTTDFPEGQIEAKLIAGWLQQLGLKINLSVIDRGAHEAHVCNYKGTTYAPDFDMYVDDWAGYSDPGQTLTARDHGQIGATNEPCWSNAAFDRLDVEQAAALDPTTRQNLIWQMQQIMYQQTPWVVLVYPQYLRGLQHLAVDRLDSDAQRARAGLHGDRRHTAGRRLIPQPAAGGCQGHRRRE